MSDLNKLFRDIAMLTGKTLENEVVALWLSKPLLIGNGLRTNRLSAGDLIRGEKGQIQDVIKDQSPNKRILKFLYHMEEGKKVEVFDLETNEVGIVQFEW